MIYYSALHQGNSGQVVYAVHSKEDILYPLGILVGEPKLQLKKPPCGSHIYFAALLAPNLDCIEERHQLYVSDLKSLSSHSKQHEPLNVTLANLAPPEQPKVSNQSKTQPTAGMLRQNKVVEGCHNTISATSNENKNLNIATDDNKNTVV